MRLRVLEDCQMPSPSRVPQDKPWGRQINVGIHIISVGITLTPVCVEASMLFFFFLKGKGTNAFSSC